MSSFHKATDMMSKINGTKMKNNLPSISSGIPSLDHIIGGSIPTGTLFMVEEDVMRNYCRVMTKYFLAEGVVCKHDLLVASLDEDPKDIVSELPVPTASSVDNDGPINSEDSDKMKIAWRYEAQGPVESSFGTNTNFGHHFDLSKHVSADVIKDINVTYWCETKDNSVKDFQNPSYCDLLRNINALISKEIYQSTSKENQNVLRISISSLGSPMWMSHEYEENYNPAHCGQDLMKFIYCLRVILRNTNAVAFITVPSHLFDGEGIVNRILYSVDNAVKLESFAGSSRETNPVFKEYHGLFHITKLSATNSLVPFLPPSLDLAFKLRRKKFVIEKLHLPPELQDTSEREQDDITATPTACGGFKKKDIDF